MKKKLIRETDLFTRVNILLLENQKNNLENIKNELSLMSNIEIDNSTFMRAVIDLYTEKSNLIEDLVEYSLNNKGYEIVAQFEKMVLDGLTKKDIVKNLGLSPEIVESGMKKIKKSN